MDSRSIRQVVLVIASLAVMATLSAQDTNPRVGPKDQLSIIVFGVERLQPGPYLVDADGQIDYPMLGPITVAGKTPREVGDDISKRLVAAGFLVGTPQVTVDVKAGANRTVSVTGSVRNPGSIAYAGTLTLYDALVRVGMMTADAGDEVLVIHPIPAASSADAVAADAVPAAGAPAAADQPAADAAENDNVVKLSLRDVELGDPAANIVLRDGDRVYVPRAQSVYITGFVQSPGAYTIQPGTTLLQALTLAGGISERGTTRGIRIQRLVNGKQVRVENVTLETPVRPGDTIIVGRRIL